MLVLMADGHLEVQCVSSDIAWGETAKNLLLTPLSPFPDLRDQRSMFFDLQVVYQPMVGSIFVTPELDCG